MAKTKTSTKQTKADIEKIIGDKEPVKVIPTGLTKFKVMHPVLGYKVGDTFEATYDSVKRQLKHKSIEVA